MIHAFFFKPRKWKWFFDKVFFWRLYLDWWYSGGDRMMRK